MAKGDASVSASASAIARAPTRTSNSDLLAPPGEAGSAPALALGPMESARISPGNEDQCACAAEYRMQPCARRRRQWQLKPTTCCFVQCPAQMELFALHMCAENSFRPHAIGPTPERPPRSRFGGRIGAVEGAERADISTEVEACFVRVSERPVCTY